MYILTKKGFVYMIVMFRFNCLVEERTWINVVLRGLISFICVSFVFEKLFESLHSRHSKNTNICISLVVPLLMDDDAIAFGEEEETAHNANKLKHPYITLFHLAFRIAAIVVYMLCGWFSNSFIASFVTVVLLLSMDFWTVKNITGRLMVGLRWWNYVDDDGKSHWVFESKKNRINATEARIFWLALILCPLFWSILFIVALFGFKFKWLLLVCIAIVLNGANLYGYVKCKMGNDKNISAATSDFIRKQVIENVASIMTRSPPTNNSSQPTNVI